MSSKGSSKTRVNWLIVLSAPLVLLVFGSLSYNCDAVTTVFTKLGIAPPSELTVECVDGKLCVARPEGIISTNIQNARERKQLLTLLKSSFQEGWLNKDGFEVKKPRVKLKHVWRSKESKGQKDTKESSNMIRQTSIEEVLRSETSHRKEEHRFLFFKVGPLKSDSLEGHSVYIMRSAIAENGPEVCKKILDLMNKHENIVFRSPFVFAYLKDDDDHFLGYVIAPIQKPEIPVDEYGQLSPAAADRKQQSDMKLRQLVANIENNLQERSN